MSTLKIQTMYLLFIIFIAIAIAELHHHPLHTAAGNGLLKEVKAILEATDVNLAVADGTTALHRAAYMQQLKMTRYLLDRGADPTKKSRDGQTPLHLSLLANNVSTPVVELLANKSRTIINSANNDGARPLGIAAGRSLLGAARALLRAGAAIDFADKQGFTPLHLAARENEEMVRLLLEAGATGRGTPATLSSPLHIAAFYNRSGVVRALMDAPGSKKALAAQDGQKHTPLVSAVLAKAHAVVDVLVGYGGVNEADGNGVTPLHAAVYVGDFKLVQKLLAAGGDPTIEDANGGTAVENARSLGHRDIATAIEAHQATRRQSTLRVEEEEL